MFEWVSVSVPVPTTELLSLLLVNWGIGVVMIGVYALAWMVDASHVRGARITAGDMGKLFGFIAPFGLLLIVAAAVSRLVRG